MIKQTKKSRRKKRYLAKARKEKRNTRKAKIFAAELKRRLQCVEVRLKYYG